MAFGFLKFSILISAFAITLSENNDDCPIQCDCDLFDGLNRAVCNNQHLISPYLEIPKNVEILNLSENEITVLDDDCFKDYAHLKNLSLSHNSIHTIYLDAFNNLNQLETIDLSYNRLEYFDERIFENNPNLLQLNLSGNKFATLRNKPIFLSKSVSDLSLSNSQLAQIYPEFFVKLPSLERLDLSGNILITLASAAFMELSKLQHLNLQSNRWNCDENFVTAINYLKNHAIDIKIDKCLAHLNTGRTSLPGKMFERMMMAPKTATLSDGDEPLTSKDTNMIWKRKSIENITHSAQVCTQDCIKRCNFTEFCVLARARNAQSTTITIYIIFASGTVVGLVFGIMIAFTFNFCCKNAARKSFEGAITSHTLQEVPVTSVVRQTRNSGTRGSSNATRSTSQSRRLRAAACPPRSNVQRERSVVLRRSLSSPERSNRGMTDSECSDFATFVTRLFERPARVRYRRAINQGTSNLIRRLSRSSLFLRSTSSNGSYGDYHHNSSRPNYSDENCDTENLIEEQQTTSTSERFRRNELGEESRTREVEVLVPRRPETPPPAYKDVVVRV